MEQVLHYLQSMARKKNSTVSHYASWPTAWGPVGAAGCDEGLVRFILPHYLPDQIDEVLAWEYPKAVKSDEPFEELIELTRAYFNAKPSDFTDIKCSLPSETTFTGKALRALREVPFGSTVSYRDLAMKIHLPDSARAIATAMGKNPIPLIVPCHRVIYSSGKLGGFSAEGGTALKQKMLDLEAKS